MANKKAQRRPKARARAARPAAWIERDVLVEEASTTERAPSAPAAVGAEPAPRMPAATVRRAQSARRAPVTTINYAYLGRDLRSLAILAPSMVILVIIAFIFIH